jgi:hypothetical protein
MIAVFTNGLLKELYCNLVHRIPAIHSIFVTGRWLPGFRCDYWGFSSVPEPSSAMTQLIANRALPVSRSWFGITCFTRKGGLLIICHVLTGSVAWIRI